jgi:hypothetical protein
MLNESRIATSQGPLGCITQHALQTQAQLCALL